MQEDDILDEVLVPDSDKDIWEPIRWWEKKRPYYNLLIILTVAGSLLLASKSPGKDETILIIVISIFLLLIANAFYTLGWSFELLIKYRFKSFKFPKGVRAILLLLGSLLTAYLFWLTTMDLITHGV